MNQSVNEVFEQSAREFLSDGRIQRLLSGRMSREDLREFFRHFIVTHLNSVQILAFLLSLTPRDSSDLVKENLLEEMGFDQSELSHPDLLIDLARGLGFTDQDIIRLRAEADQARRDFATAELSYKSLREMGLSVLLETVAFESLLSQVSDQIGQSLINHYGISAEAVEWFTLHGEVDVKHAEEGKQVLQQYISHYRFSPSEVKEIVNHTFDQNVYLNRYFPIGSALLHHRGPSRVTTVEILPLRIPFNQTFDHSQISRSSSDTVVVRVRGSEGLCGYGEGLPRPYVTGEDVESMVGMLGSTLAPGILKLTFQEGMDALDQVQALTAEWASQTGSTSQVVTWNATQCALELALLDWTFKRAGKSLTDWLPPARSQVTYTGVIDATDPEAAGQMAARYASSKFSSLKVKVGIGEDLKRLEVVRKAAGDHVGIRVDANGAWELSGALSALGALQAFDIEAVEQPVAAADLTGMRQIREELGISVIADESLVTLEDAIKLIEEQACDVFNVRVSKCGGILASKAIAELGLSTGMKVQIGAQVGETSLLSAAGRHLAAHLSQIEYAEGSFGTYLLSEDVTLQPVMFGHQGLGDLVLGDGLGVKVDDDTLARLAIRIVQVGA